MSYAIVGSGKIGQALAHAFARKNIDVTVASRRAPEELAPQARAIGPTVVAKSLRDALRRPQAKNKVCTDREFVDAVLRVGALAFGKIMQRQGES